ncbi:MAG: hypothetical protein PHQ35_08175 [Phycisphaerae bacterium]|nr:hypothetical protein [Phycisphaerae bacterium]MDD5380138.1 hypothetical protein [Phycisphaerae bacterium]
MSQIDTDENILSETEAGQEEAGNSLKLVPVAESIRYRKRAQSAEKKIETLTEELAEAKSQTSEMTKELSSVKLEQKLIHKLAAAGAIDVEAAALIAKAKIGEDTEADLDGVIGQLKKEKQYLFSGTGSAVTAKKTAGAKDRTQNSQTILERAAKKAATTGNRTDLQEYLKLRRNFV